MEIKEITEKNIWENFLLTCQEKTFLQSWNWGEFQKSMGQKIWRFGFFEQGKLLAVCLVVKVKARRGRFLFVPHGPAVGGKKPEVLRLLTGKLRGLAKQEKCSFVRIAPVWGRSPENENLFKELGFLQAPIHAHAELSWLLDLNPTEGELLKQMRKTTRYLIKQGENIPDLKIIKSQDVEDVQIFSSLYKETVKRHHFQPFSLRYLEKEFLSFSKDNQAVIFLARHKEEYLASCVIVFWQGTGFYHQGASVQSKIPAAYLMQWEAIKEAKKRGCGLYNFWGIADIIQNSKVKSQNDNIKKHPWAGLTLFKMGFGGYPKAYLKTQDLPISFRYRAVRIFEFLRKRKRGF